MKYTREVEAHKVDFSDKASRDKLRKWCEDNKLLWKVETVTGGGLQVGKYKDRMTSFGGAMDWGSVKWITYDGEYVDIYNEKEFETRYKKV